MKRPRNGIALSRADKAFDVLDYILLTIAFLLVAYPLYFVVIASVSDPIAVYEGRVIIWPIKPTLEGYARIFSYESLFIGYKNTLLYTLIGTAINVVMTITAGYALSRKELVGRNVMMMGVMFTMIFSGGMIPNYLLVRSLGLYNTMWALILPGAVSTWNLIVCRTFFQQTIPDELREAAELDGCGDTGFFLRVVLPLSSSIIAVMVLFYAVSHWNSYYNALIYLSSTSKYPLQLVLRNILIVNTLDDMVNDVATQAAQQRMGDLIKYGMIIVSSLPLLVLYPFLQKYFVQGVMIGAIKG
ncbi:MAG: carbohydrate ABC transporter permease [Clostridia bacterium]|jgi:putative aldouronate transport system permease protein|nr:carbohydrate ABC transporter permease [Clostridia bacterium]